MNPLLVSSIIGASAGIVGTGLGGMIAFFLDTPSKRLLSTLLSFSSGLMIAVVCFDLLPKSFEIGSFACGIMGIILGVAVIIFCEHLIYRDMESKGKNELLKTGILLTVGIALHNLPEGLAIGSGFTAYESYGLGLSLVIALHDIPEGVAMATPLRAGGMDKLKVFMLTLLSGVPTGLGAFIGYLLGGISPMFISICLAFAGGAMLYITCAELIPESVELYKGRISSLGLLFGVILGIVISSMM